MPRSDALTVGSLFSGIGGLDLGLEWAGMRTVWQAESDPFARAVLWQHWPLIPKYDDVRTMGAANVPPIDVLCGGFPCQDISGAGKRAGIGGARSGLWGEFARLIRALRPRYVLVENVAALRVRGLGRVLGDLAESGYDAEWDCIPASAVGAPHQRDRVFVVAYASGIAPQPDGRSGNVELTTGGNESASRQRQRLRDAAGGRGAVVSNAAEFSEREPPDQTVAIAVRGQAWPFPGRGGWWESEPSVGRVADGIPRRVDQLRCLGNAVVPQVAEHIGRMIVAHARTARAA